MLVGDTGVGKTSLVSRLLFDDVPTSHIPTIGASFSEIIISGRTLCLWDTAGQERYASLASMYLRETGIALVVFDLSDAGSMDRVSHWVKTVLDHAERAQIVVVGNKCDTGSNPYIGGRVKEMGYMYTETSAKTGAGIYDLTSCLSSAIDQCCGSALCDDSVPLLVPGDRKCC